MHVSVFEGLGMGKSEVWGRVHVYLLYVLCFYMSNRSTNGNFIWFILICACPNVKVTCRYGIAGSRAQETVLRMNSQPLDSGNSGG